VSIEREAARIAIALRNEKKVIPALSAGRILEREEEAV
jgi:hypothetical protein